MKIFLTNFLFLLISGCAGMGYELRELAPEIDESDYVDGEEVEEEVEVFDRVLRMHFLCCVDLCKGSRKVQSVAKEINSKYIRCTCTNGKEFRVTRTKKGRKK